MMKFFHLADLHIGKRVCEHSMLEDQKHILGEIVSMVRDERPDAVLIAGDVYDKSVPSAEAVGVLDDFLVQLSATGTQVFVISGNHDSAERIAFGGRLMASHGVHMSPTYNAQFLPVTLKDELGEVDVWMLPFVRPAEVRSFETAEGDGDSCVEGGAASVIANFTDAVRVAVSHMQFTPGRRNVLVAHQFVTGAKVDQGGSEENVGGLDNADASAFKGFDYVALGHIHRPQNITGDAGQVIRYSGTPLKYSLSEATHQKSVTVVELGAQGASVREIPLKPLHDVREIRGTFAELVSPEFRTAQVAAGNKLDDYVYVKLTDENDVLDAAQKLRGVYPNLMMLDYDNERTRNQQIAVGVEAVEKKSPMELFEEFFCEMNCREINGEESEFVQSIIEGIWGDER